MSEDAKRAIHALRRAHDELVRIAEHLDADALTRQSGSSEWTVADVLGHLGSASEIGLTRVTTGKSGGDAATAIWNRWNAMEPAEKAAGFVSASRRLVEALEALDADSLAATRIDVGFLPQPIDVAFYTRMRLTEVGLHRWDIEVAFDPAATVADYIVPFILAQLPFFCGRLARPAGKAGRVAVQTADPQRSYTLDVRPDGAGLTEGGGGDAGTRLALPAEAFTRLATGRLAPSHTPASVGVEGELSLDDLRRVFPGY